MSRTKEEELKTLKKRTCSVLLALLMVCAMAVPGMAEGMEKPSNLTIKQVKNITPIAKATSYSYSKIKVSWDRVEGLDGYVVYQATGKSGKYKKAYTVDNPETLYYIKTDLTTGKTYYYKIRGYKNIAKKKVYTKYSAVRATYAKPNKASILSTETTDRAITLKLKKISGATGHAIYRKVQNGVWKYLTSTTESSVDLGRIENAEYRARAYRTVNGKKIYGLYSNTYFDSFDEGSVDNGNDSDEKNTKNDNDNNPEKQENGQQKSTKSFFLDCYYGFIEIGEPFSLVAKIEPTQKITWTTSDASIGTVSQDGIVTAKTVGKFSVTATDENGNKRTCNLYAVDSATPTIDRSNLLGDDGKLLAVIINGRTVEFRDPTTNRGELGTPCIVLRAGTVSYSVGAYYTFSSSDDKTAAVDRSGRIKAVGAGNARITASPKAEYKKWAKEAYFDICVKSEETQKEIKFKLPDVSKMDTAGSGMLVTVYYADGSPADVNLLNITAESTDEKVATVVSNFQGLYVTPCAEGIATIKATTVFGTSASFDVEVINVDVRRKEQTKRLMEEIGDNVSEYQKLQTLCAYISREYTYSTSGHSANAMFMNRCGDCWAYSDLVNYYSNQLGMQSVTIKEIWTGNVRHTTNRVKADGQWYYVDCSINRGGQYTLQETDYQP